MAGMLLSPRFVDRLRRLLDWADKQMSAGSTNRRKQDQLVPYMFRRFELADELTIGGTAEAYLLKWDSDSASYIPDTTRTFTVADTRGLYRGWARVSGVRSGAWGRAIKPHDRDNWEIIELQNVANYINFTLTEDMGDTTTGEATATVDDYYQGVDPTIVFSEIKVFDPQNIHANASTGDKGKARLDNFSDEYHIVDMKASDARTFGKVQTGWTNTKAGSAASELVSVKTCDWDGDNEAGDAFDASTMIHANLDTALFTDYVVEIATVADGTKVIVSNIWDDPIGTIKWESVETANIRAGWRLCDDVGGITPDLRGYFIMCIDEDNQAPAPLAGSEDVIGKTGGERSTGTALPFDSVVGTPGFDDSDFTVTEVRESNVGSGDDDTRPRFYVLAAIQRFE